MKDCMYKRWSICEVAIWLDDKHLTELVSEFGLHQQPRNLLYATSNMVCDGPNLRHLILDGCGY